MILTYILNIFVHQICAITVSQYLSIPAVAGRNSTVMINQHWSQDCVTSISPNFLNFYPGQLKYLYISYSLIFFLFHYKARASYIGCPKFLYYEPVIIGQNYKYIYFFLFVSSCSSLLIDKKPYLALSAK